MNAKIVFLLFSLLISFVSAADIHPALKDAIDHGNMKMATNLIKKVGVKDLYLPASLSVKDAENLYKDLLAKDSRAFFYCRSDGKALCDSTFKKNYIMQSCMGKRETDFSICNDWMSEADPSEWLDFKEGICQSKQTLKNCQRLIQSIPPKDRIPYFKWLEKKGLLRYKGIVRDTTFNEFIPKKECADFYAKQEREERKSINNNSWYSESRKKEELKKLETRIKEQLNKCLAGNIYHEVTKTMNVLASPFGQEMQETFVSMTDSRSWENMGEDWKNDLQYLKKVHSEKTYFSKEGYPSEEDLFAQIKSGYAKDGDYWIPNLIYDCTMYPNIDKKVSKEFGFQLFSCKDILQNKNPSVPCDESAGVLKYFETSLNAGEKVALICDKGKWRYPEFHERLIMSRTVNGVKRDTTALCTSDNLGSIVWESKVCDTLDGKKQWIDIIEALAPREKCEEGLTRKGRYNSDYEYLCKNGLWCAARKNCESNEDNVLLCVGVWEAIPIKPAEIYHDSSDKIRDVRDCDIYETIRIGNQTWMAENLRHRRHINDTLKFYSWNDLPHDSVGGFVISVCPSGWHVPTSDEWSELGNYLSNYADDETRALIDSVFYKNAHQGYGYGNYRSYYFGSRDNVDYGYENDGSTYFWTSTEIDSTNALYWQWYSGLHGYSTGYKERGFNVRCIKDSPEIKSENENPFE